MTSLASLLLVAMLSGPGTALAQDTAPAFDPAEAPPPETAPLGRFGRSLYQENCAPCHGTQGMGDGPTVSELPGPPTAFADPDSIWERSPAQLFYTTKFGITEKLMPPWRNRMSDEQIWQTVAFAWSLHTNQRSVEDGATLYAESCASCHGTGGQGDGPEAEGTLPDFTNLEYAMASSQAQWLAGWQAAHPEIGAEWSLAQQTDTLEYVRSLSLVPPWVSPYRPGTGTITGEVVQGTAGGPAVGGIEVALEAYLGFEPLAFFTTTVDSEGRFTFEDLAEDPEIAYLASVSSEGISYSSDFLSLTPLTNTAQISVPVYATTTDPTSLRLNRVHWILDHQPGALIVAQIYGFGNGSDRTYVGQQVDGVDEPVTAALVIPPGAVEVTFENGELGNRFQQVGEVVYDTLPIVPGELTRQIIVQYALPYNGTTVSVAQEFLYAIDRLSLLAANLPNLAIVAPALTFSSVESMQGREYQLWGQSNLQPQTLEVTLDGLLEQGAVDPRAAQASAEGQPLATTTPPIEPWVAWTAGIAIVVLMLGVLLVAWRRGTAAMPQSRQQLAQVRDALLAQIAQLDDQHASGQLTEDSWLQQRSQLKAQLLDVSRRMNRR